MSEKINLWESMLNAKMLHTWAIKNWRNLVGIRNYMWWYQKNLFSDKPRSGAKNVTHFATPKSDKDVIWIQKKSFLCMGSHFMNPGPSSKKLKSVWQAYFYFWYLKQFTSTDTHLRIVFLLLFLFAMSHNFKWNRKVLTRIQYSMIFKHFSTCHNAHKILIT